jgi:hypothetical protein
MTTGHGAVKKGPRTFEYSYSHTEIRDIESLEFFRESPFSAAPSDHRAVFKRVTFSPLAGAEGSQNALVLAALEGVRGSITSQIAVQMSKTAIEDKACVICSGALPRGEHPLATEIVRETLREANAQVYVYAHKMQAGGKIAATGFVASFDGARLTAARVGKFESFLLRDGALSSLYDQSPVSSETERDEKGGVLQRFIGANAQILVDLASVSIQPDDIIVLTSLSPGVELSQAVAEVLAQGSDLTILSKRIAEKGLLLSVLQGEDEDYSLEKNIFVAVLRVARPPIALTEVIE